MRTRSTVPPDCGHMCAQVGCTGPEACAVLVCGTTRAFRCAACRLTTIHLWSCHTRSQVLKPTGEVLGKLPALKEAMEARRTATLDYDAYMRRVEALQAGGKPGRKASAELESQRAKAEAAKVCGDMGHRAATLLPSTVARTALTTTLVRTPASCRCCRCC